MNRISPAAEPPFTRKVLITVGIVIVALLVWKLAPVLMLAFGGVVVAAVIRAAAVPLARRTHMSETVAVSIVTALLVALVVGGGYFFGQRIAEEAQAMWTALREAWAKFEEFVNRFPIGLTAMESMRQGTDADALAKVAKGTVTVFGAFADVLLVMFLAAYLAISPRIYRDGLLRLMPPSVRERVGGALDASGVALRKWLIGQLGAMVFVGVLTFIGLWAIGVPLALPLAILMMLALPPALALLGIVGFGMVFGLIGVLFAMPLLVVTMVLVQKLYVEPIEE